MLLTVLLMAVALAFAGTLMVNRDLRPNVDVVQSIAPAVYTATATGTGVDLQGYDSAMVEFDSGALAGAGLFAYKIQDSDDNATFADVVAPFLSGAFITPVATQVQRVGYLGPKRYIRAVATYTSGTSLAISATVLRSRANQVPLA